MKLPDRIRKALFQLMYMPQIEDNIFCIENPLYLTRFLMNIGVKK